MGKQYDKWLALSIEEEKKDKGLCGAGPFTLPKWFPMTPACNVHDRDYVVLRRLALQAYEHLKTAKKVKHELNKTDYWTSKIKWRDEQFKKRMRGIGLSSKWRWLYRQFESILHRIVDAVGWKVWERGTIREWKRMKKL